MAEQYTNFASTTLQTGIDSNDLTVPVSTGTGSKFPSTGDFMIKIDNELIRINSRSGDNLNMVDTARRGMEGTTAVSHLAGAEVKLVLTVASFIAGINDRITTHEALADPHLMYQRESEKGVASGYASLAANARVPSAQLGSGTADATTFLRGDGAWAVPAGGGGGGSVLLPSKYDYAIVYNAVDDNFDVWNMRTGTIVSADGATIAVAWNYVKTQLGTSDSLSNGGNVFFTATTENTIIPVDAPIVGANADCYTMEGPGTAGGVYFQVVNVAAMQGTNDSRTGAGTANHKWALDMRDANRVQISGFVIDCNNVKGCGGIITRRRSGGVTGGPKSFSRVFDNTVLNYQAEAYTQGDVTDGIAGAGTANCYWERNHTYDAKAGTGGFTDKPMGMAAYMNDWHVIEPQVNSPDFGYPFYAEGGTGQLAGAGGHIASSNEFAPVYLGGGSGGGNTIIGDNLYLDNIGDLIGGTIPIYGIHVKPNSGSRVSRLRIAGLYCNGNGGSVEFLYFELTGTSRAQQCSVTDVVATGATTNPLKATIGSNDGTKIVGLIVGGTTLVADAVVSSASIKYRSVGTNMVETTGLGGGSNHVYHYDNDMGSTTAIYTHTASNTTFADVPGMFVTLAANQRYKGRIIAFIDGDVAGDAKMKLTVPAGATGKVGVLAPQVGATTQITTHVNKQLALTDDMTNLGTVGTTSNDRVMVIVEFVVQLATAGGVIQVQFAQMTSNAVVSRMLADSTIEASVMPV